MGESANGSGGTPGRAWVEMAALAAAAAAVRAVGIGESLWLDELFSVWVVASPDGTLAERAGLGNAAAPFYWLVWASLQLFGSAEWAVRLPSLVFGAAVPVVVYALARSMTGSVGAARLAGTLVALDGMCAGFGAEARPYPVLQFLGGLQLLAFWALVTGRSRWWRVTFVAATVGVGYIHFTGLALVAGEVAFYLLLWVRGERPSYRPAQFALDLCVAGAALLPLVPLVLAVAGRRTNFLLSAAPVGIESLVVAHRQSIYLLLPAVAAAVVAFARRGGTPGAVPNTRALAFLLVVFYATAVPIWASHIVGGPSVFRSRYTAILYLMVPVGAGACCVSWPGRGARVTFALAALVLGQLTDGAVRKVLSGRGSVRVTVEDWRAAVDWVNKHPAGERAPVFVRSGLIEAEEYLASGDPLARIYLLNPVRTVYTLDAPDRRPLTFDGDFVDDADAGAARAAGEAWFVVKGDSAFVTRVADRVTRRLAVGGAGAEVVDRKAWRNVEVFRVRFTAAPR